MSEFNLIKSEWKESDIKEFKDYVFSFSKGEEKGKWEQRIINTKLPCIAAASDILKKISKEICKGDYESFLSYWPCDNFSLTSVIGSIICQIKDFNKMKIYLDKYIDMADNWANIDLLKFKINNDNKDKFFNLALEKLKSKKTFIRRTGVIILLKMLKIYDLDKIINEIKKLKEEKEYYVNMAVAWLICDLFILDREKAIKLFEEKSLNQFVNNKAISKCRDSYRVSKEDKELLITFRQKKRV